MRFNEEFCWKPWYVDWIGSENGSMLVCSWFDCLHGHYCNILQLHSFLLLICFYGFTIHLEWWACFHGCLRLITEKSSSQSRCSRPLCSRRLGYGNIIPCSICFVSGHNGVVLWRHGRLQFEGGMYKIPNGYCISFLKLDNYRYFRTHYAMASCSRLGFSVNCAAMYTEGKKLIVLQCIPKVVFLNEFVS